MGTTYYCVCSRVPRVLIAIWLPAAGDVALVNDPCMCDDKYI